MKIENNIFHFNDSPALQVQCSTVCQNIYKDFWSKIATDSWTDQAFPKLKEDWVAFTQKLVASGDIHWFPSYAAAVLFRQLNSLEFFVTVVGLDGWKFRVHASNVKVRENTAVPDILNPACFELGPFPKDKAKELLEVFIKELEKSEQGNRGSRRGHAHGHEGNQKTPSFLKEKLSQAMENLKKVAAELGASNGCCTIQGGTTDVGQHTGCLLRNTSAPLVFSVVQKVLQFLGEPDDDCFNTLMGIYLVRFLGDLPEVALYDARKMDRFIIVMQEAEPHVMAIQNQNLQKSILDYMIEYRRELEMVPYSKPRPPLENDLVADLLKGLKTPEFPFISKIENESNKDSKLNRARKEAEINLDWCDIESPTFNGKLRDAWVQLHSLNTDFWEIASDLKQPDAHWDIDHLVSKLDRLSNVVQVATAAANDSALIMTTTLRSYEFLATWICFCWAHKMAEKKFDWFHSEYMPALHPKDLNVLVLEHSRASLAADDVRTFLEKRGNGCYCPFRHAKDSLHLALKYGNVSSLNKIHADFITGAVERIDQRWKLVQEKQQKLRELDAKLRKAKSDLESAEHATRQAQQLDYNFNEYGRKVYGATVYTAQNAEHSASCEVQNLEAQIRQQEVKPQHLIFSLPRNRNIGLQWLFFFYMDPCFVHVASLAHRGQSILWKDRPAAKQVRQFLHGWFQNHGSFPATNQGDYVLGSQSGSPPHASLPDIRYFQRETGVFFPDAFSLDPIWNGSDPFDNLDRNMLSNWYTENLPLPNKGSHFMQSFVVLLPTTSRENEGLAQRQEKPDWLTQEQYATYSTIRATPRTQLRNLAHAVSDDLLPFHHPCVHVLLKQGVFQLGEKEWNTDWHLGANSGLSLLHECLSLEVKVLSDSPKNCRRLEIVGVLLAYFAQYHDPCAETAREASVIFETWARTIAVASQDQRQGDLYARQASFYASSLFCRSYFELSDDNDDIETVLKLVALFRNCSLLSEGAVGSALEDAVLKFMGTRIVQVIAHVRKCPSILSSILQLIDETAPANLSWHEVRVSGARSIPCFETVAAGNNLYSVNVLNGIVLFDGSPKHFLPHSVVGDELFVRTFGRRNFEAIPLGSQHYKMARKIGQNIYEFKMDPNEGLCIFEYDCSSGQKRLELEKQLRLLPRQNLEIPSHLQEPFSHWYSHSTKTVIFRPPEASQPDIHYIMSQEGMFFIPLKDRTLQISNLLSKSNSYERLLLGGTPFSQALDSSGFEHGEFILVFAKNSSSEQKLRYCLPRYRLNFFQDAEGIHSEEYEGYKLARDQNLPNTLPGVKCFLLMACDDGSTKCLIPALEVQHGAQMRLPDSWADELHFHSYNTHLRFGSFIASGTSGRLHLASLYASNSCLLPDRLLLKRGEGMAMDLVRQCIQNEEYSNEEEVALARLSTHSPLSCGLRLLIWWASRCSKSLVHLYGGSEDTHPELQYDALAAAEYRCNKNRITNLKKEEEEVILGTVRRRADAWPTQNLASQAKEHTTFIQDVERKLQREGIATSPCRPPTRFPLELSTQGSKIASKMVNALKESYTTFLELPRYSFKDIDLDPLQAETVQRREDIEQKLLTTLNSMRDRRSISCYVTGGIERASKMGLMRLAFDPISILEYQPAMNPDECIEVQADAIGWCLFCVFEDKLTRLVRARRQGNDSEWLQEMRCVRNWDPVMHQRWLVFEVEQMLQIRPKQYITIKRLLDNPGSAIQLNMGQGKTRVLVPMLILELCKNQGQKARVNLLPAIFHEALQYFRLSLVASVHSVNLFTLPFQRSFVLNQKTSNLLADEMRRCWTLGGCLVVTPQHRNSLLLKQYDSDVTVGGLEDSVVDILDESDAILDYNFQLVYAIGNQIPLPSCSTRYHAAEALLKVFVDNVADVIDIFRKFRDNEKSSIHMDSLRTAPGEFPYIRLLDLSFDEETQIAAVLAAHLMRDPPHHFRWMRKIKDDERRKDLLLNMLVNARLDGVKGLLSDCKLFDKNREDILAFRGCLAFGLLFHALKNRYRVSYGRKSHGLLNGQCGEGNKHFRASIAYAQQRVTNIAVPYAASDTPKQRAEFTHPDMAILYTCLSYLHEGLTRAQFMETLRVLDTKKRGLQDTVYSEWIAGIRDGVPANELEVFDNIKKVDVTNTDQIEKMYARMHRCMDVVFFWLYEIVFPNETHQFPQRRVSSAWNLSESKTAIGFSGTHDNHLPLSITQISHTDAELRATDGEMIDLILNCTKKVHVFDTSALNGRQRGWTSIMHHFGIGARTVECLLPWEIILDDSLRLGASALIDVGGLMAGAKASDIIKFVAQWIESRLRETADFRGIVYFSVETNQWMVYQLESKQNVALDRSAIKEDRCFVYFDESRCRGSDMKLLASAGAVVTLDKRMTKDKFLQGCARMRKLGRDNQWLVIAGNEETLSKKSSVKNVVEGIIETSIHTSQKALLTYFDRAQNFHSFPTPVDDELDLEALYAGYKRDYEDLRHYLDSHFEAQEHSDEILSQAVGYCREHGEGAEVHISTIGQECEKEVETEAEEQEEEETQLESRYPYAQIDWHYSYVFDCPDVLFRGTFVKLKDVIRAKVKTLSDIRWSDKVYCSPNFFKTIACYDKRQDLSLYLLPVSHVIIFEDGRVVLISAYEMDKLLPLWWAKHGTKPRAVLDNLFLLNQKKGGCRLAGHLLPVSVEVMTTLKLFRGYVDFSNDEKKELEQMLQDVKRPHDKMQELLYMRSRDGYFERSDLDNVSYSVSNT